MTNPAMEIPTRRVDMWFAGTSPQRRATVAFRIILAIPQIIVLYFLFIALFIVVVIGWFGALFMGRLPRWVHAFVSGVVRWATRVGAYLFLLTDRYPPFSLEDETYPARPMLPPPGGRLNRWSVLFRVILGIPAAVFYEVVLYGLTLPLLIVMWVVVVVRGNMPEPLYDAYAALLRYEVRYHSWFTMLTSEYPWGMLGDPPAPATTATPAAPTSPGTPSAPAAPTAPPASPSPGTPPAYPAYPASPGSGPPASTTQAFSYPASDTPPETPTDTPQEGAPSAGAGAGAGSVWPPPVPPPPTGLGAMPPPSQWERSVPTVPGAELPPWGRLVLQGAARSWMIFAIVWGAVLFVGQNVAQSIIRGHNHNHNNTALVRPTHTVVADSNRASDSGSGAPQFATIFPSFASGASWTGSGEDPMTGVRGALLASQSSGTAHVAHISGAG